MAKRLTLEELQDLTFNEIEEIEAAPRDNARQQLGSLNEPLAIRPNTTDTTDTTDTTENTEMPQALGVEPRVPLATQLTQAFTQSFQSGKTYESYAELKKKEAETGIPIATLTDFPDIEKYVGVLRTANEDEIKKLVTAVPEIAERLLSSPERILLSQNDIPSLAHYGTRISSMSFGSAATAAQADWNAKTLENVTDEVAGVLGNAYYAFWSKYHGTMASVYGGKVLERDKMGFRTTLPDITLEIAFPMANWLMGKEVGDPTMNAYMGFAENHLYYEEKLKNREEWNVIEKLGYGAMEQVGQQAAWYADSMSWVLWGLVITGALLAMSGAGAPAGAPMLATGASGLGIGASGLGIAGLLSTMKFGSDVAARLGRFQSMRLSEFWGNYWDGMSHKDRAGNPLPEDTIVKAAWGASFPQAVQEYVQSEILFSMFPAQWKPSGWFNRGLSDTAKSFIPKPFWQMTMGHIASGTFGLAEEMAQEFGQSATWDLTHRLLRHTSDQEFDYKTLGEDLEGAFEEAKETFWSFGLLAALGTGGKIYHDTQNIKTAIATRNKWNQVAEMAEQTQTGQLDKSAIAGDVEAISKNADKGTAWLSRKFFRQYFQERGLNAEEAAMELGVLDQYLENLPSQDDSVGMEADQEFLAVDARTYAEKVAMTEHREGLVEHTKDSYEGITPHEAEELVAKVTEQLQAVEADIKEQMSEGNALREQARLMVIHAIPDASTQQVEDYSMIMAKNAMTLASKIEDTTPQEILSRVTFDREKSPLVSEVRKGLKQDARGHIHYNIADGRAVISLFEGSDASTLIHEFSGHFYTETLLNAEANGTLNELGKYDLGVLRKWVNSTDGLFTEEQSEKIAMGVETYFMEGIAPSTELYETFKRVKQLLLDVYNNIRLLGNVELTDDVRAVFDTWLATNNEVEEQQSLESFQAFYDMAEKIGATDEQMQHALQVLSNAKQEEDKSIVENLVKPLTTRVKKLSERRKEIEASAHKELSNQPVYKARKMIFGIAKDGEMYKPHKDEIVSLFGERGLEVFKGGYVVDGDKAVGLDLIAQVAGYTGQNRVNNMYEELSTMPKISEAVRRGVQNVIDREIQQGLYGQDFQAIVADVRGNDKRILGLALEHVITKGNTGNTYVQDANIIVKNAKAYARQALLGKDVRDISVKKFLADERKYGRAFEKAIVEGNLELATRFKELQTLSQAFVQEAMAIEKKIAQTKKLIQKYAKRGLNTYGLDDSVLNAIDEVINDVRDRYVDQETVKEFNQATTEELNTPEATKVITDITNSTLIDMKLADLLALGEALGALQQAGKDTVKKTAEQREMAFNAAVAEIVEHGQKTFDPNKHDKSRRKVNQSFVENAKDKLDYAANEHMNVDSLCKKFDQNINGPARKWIYQVIENGYNEMTRLEQKAAYKYNELLMSKLFKKRNPHHNRIQYDSVVGGKQVTQDLNTNNMFQIALLYGHAEGRERLKSGYGWGEQQVLEILSNLSAEELRAVNELWTFYSMFFDEANKLHKEVFGKSMKFVEAIPYKINGQELSGGYSAIFYDKQISTWSAEADFERILSNITTNEGYTTFAADYTETRAATAPKGAVVSLDMLASLTRHMNQVTRDLGLQTPARDVHAMLINPDVKAELTRVLGQSGYDQFIPWIKAVVKGGESPVKGVEAVFKKARQGAVIAGLCHKYGPGISQLFGFSSAAVEIGPANVGMAILEFYSNPMTWSEKTKFVHDSSVFMKYRRTTFDRDVSTIVRSYTLAGKMDVIRAAGFYYLGLMDASVTIPVWLKAYDLKINELGHEGASQYADQVIRHTNNVGRVIDLAAVQRGSELRKMLTMYYSYLGMLNRMTQYEIGKAVREKDLARGAAFLMWGLTIPAIGMSFIKHGAPDVDEDEPYYWTLAKWTTKQTLLYGASLWVGIRDVASLFDGYGYSMTPTATGMKGSFDGLSRAYKLWEQDQPINWEEEAPKLADMALKGIEFWGAIPSTELRRRLGLVYGMAVKDEEFNPREYFFNVKPKKQRRRGSNKRSYN